MSSLLYCDSVFDSVKSILNFSHSLAPRQFLNYLLLSTSSQLAITRETTFPLKYYTICCFHFSISLNCSFFFQFISLTVRSTIEKERERWLPEAKSLISRQSGVDGVHRGRTEREREKCARKKKNVKSRKRWELKEKNLYPMQHKYKRAVRRDDDDGFSCNFFSRSPLQLKLHAIFTVLRMSC